MNIYNSEHIVDPTAKLAIENYTKQGYDKYVKPEKQTKSKPKKALNTTYYKVYDCNQNTLTNSSSRA